jgi:hypothetical protein
MSASPISPVDLHPQLAEVRHDLNNCTQRAQNLAYGLTPEQFKQRARHGGWSIAECLVHLALTSAEYIKLAEPTFADAPRGHGRFKRDLVGRILAWSLEPPYRMKTKTLTAYIPAPGQLDDALAMFVRSQHDLIATLERANGVALDKVLVRSSFNPRIQYNLLSFFSILTAHQRRHLWQAEQVRKQLQFAV